METKAIMVMDMAGTGDWQLSTMNACAGAVPLAMRRSNN
jgi:hypothetical protein